MSESKFIRSIPLLGVFFRKSRQNTKQYWRFIPRHPYAGRSAQSLLPTLKVFHKFLAFAVASTSCPAPWSAAGPLVGAVAFAAQNRIRVALLR